MRQTVETRFEEMDINFNKAKDSLINHTRHITNMKKELETTAKKRQFDELVAKMKRFALCDDYKALYDKVVPPVAQMDSLTQKMSEEIE